MSANYDNWERLVGAVLKKQQLWELFHDHSRSPSLLSEASDFNPSFNSRSPLYDLDFDFARLGSLSRSHTACSKLVVISDFRPAIDVKDVSSAEFLGRGTFGSTYAAVMDIGLRVVVKILKSTIISEPDFKRHMDIIKNVSHANVTPLRAYMLPKMNASCCMIFIAQEACMHCYMDKLIKLKLIWVGKPDSELQLVQRGVFLKFTHKMVGRLSMETLKRQIFSLILKSMAVYRISVYHT